MDDIPVPPKGSSTLFPPIKLKGRSKFCQCTPQSLLPVALAIFMLIGGGICMMVLQPCKSLTSAVEKNSVPTHSSEVNRCINSNFNKPLKRTHRDDPLGAYELSYPNNNKINFDAFNQSISDFILIAETVEESLAAYSQTQTIMLHKELMRIITSA